MNLAGKVLMMSAMLALAVVGCTDRAADPPQVSPTTSTPDASAAPAPDQWLGKWNGPEGTFLQLAGGNGQYEVIIRNLDGPRTFQGTAVGDRIEFERDGTRESVRASNGAETGMKWLSEKSDCLTVRAGEGYCRD
jgi:glucose/arabinose dehydrogenase